MKITGSHWETINNSVDSYRSTIVINSCSCLYRSQIFATWIVESTSLWRHSRPSCLCVKTWAFAIQKSCLCASHCHRSIWRKIMLISRRRKCWWNRMETIKTVAIISAQHQTPTHSSRRMQTASTEATIAWTIAHSCAHQCRSDQLHHRTTHKAAHRSAHQLARCAIIPTVSITVLTIHLLVLVISSKTWPTAHEHQAQKPSQSSSDPRRSLNAPEWTSGKIFDFSRPSE